MEQKTAIAHFTEVAEKMDFSVSFKVDAETMNGTDYESYRDIVAAFEEVAKSFDPDEEASLWIGPDGHGKNGAPYYVRDIIADMDECKNYLMELVDELNE